LSARPQLPLAEPVRKMPALGRPETGFPADDPFRYGTRWRRVRLPSGEVTEQPIPLTPEDLLDPELGDEVTQSGPHSLITTTLYDLLRRWFAAASDVLVLFDMKILWGLAGLPNPSPDLAVVRGARDKEKDRTIFKVAEEGVRPCLIIEVVSNSDAEMRRNDHEKKVEIYQRAGIPEYLIVDPPFAPEGRLLLTGYRLASDRRYRRIEPDSLGRLRFETANLLFAASLDGRTVRVADAETGDWLPTSSDVEAAQKAAEAEVVRLRAELERLRKPTG
jgi:colicin import membrane protein